jgi:hypothetical protein
VKVHVEDGLPTVALAVRDDSVSGLIEAVAAGQGGSHHVSRTDELAILRPQVEDRLDVPAWKDE